MSYGNAETFRRMLGESKSLREMMCKAAESFDGDTDDDRAVFEAVVAPVAKAAGLRLSYEELRDALADGRELTDDELDMVAGGAGTIYRTLVTGVVVGSLVFSSVPTRAIAESIDSGIEVVDAASSNGAAPTQAATTDDASQTQSQSQPGVASAFKPMVLSSAQDAGDNDDGVSEDSKEAAKAFDDSVNIAADIATMAIAIGTGDAINIVGGGKDLVGDILSIAGVSMETGPDNQDIMNGIDDIKDGIDKIQGQIQELDGKANSIMSHQDIQDTNDLIDSLRDLSSYCASVEGDLSTENLKAQGVKPLAKNHTQAQFNAWAHAANTAAKKAEAAGNADFKGYDSDMSEIKSLFIHTANLASKSAEANPISSWDRYWESVYNWETEAWAPKTALRENVEYQLMRAYSLLSVYYEIGAAPKTRQTELGDALKTALKTVTSMDAGVNPHTLDLDKPFAVKCYSLGITVTSSQAVDVEQEGGIPTDALADVSEDQVKEYYRRLGVDTSAGDDDKLDAMVDDLRQAGLWRDEYDTGATVVLAGTVTADDGGSGYAAVAYQQKGGDNEQVVELGVG